MSEAIQNQTTKEGPSAPPQPSGLPIVVASWPRNSRETVRVRLDHYQGNNTIDCRSWYPGNDGELKPGKGLTLSVKHLPKLVAALTKALEAARSHGLVPEGGDI